MLLEKNHIYHIYNQGNNRQKIFFNRENQLFFLQKMNDYLLPYCDIMAWCLMPNHFHWMVYVRQTELESVDSQGGFQSIDKVTQSASRGATQSRTPTTPRTTSLNQSIGILLASYTRAINQVNKTSGSLFRQKTKSDCITNALEISHSYYNLGFGTSILLHDPEKEYPQACFNYIHQNPVKAGLVKHAEDWEFSSYRDIIGMRAGKLINRERIAEFELSL